LAVAVDTTGADVDNAFGQGVGRNGGKKVFQSAVRFTLWWRWREIIDDGLRCWQVSQAFCLVQISLNMPSSFIGLSCQRKDLGLLVMPALR